MTGLSHVLEKMLWGLAFFVVEVELLFAGYGVAILGGGAEGPLLNGGDDYFVDAVAEAGG